MEDNQEPNGSGIHHHTAENVPENPEIVVSVSRNRTISESRSSGEELQAEAAENHVNPGGMEVDMNDIVRADEILPIEDAEEEEGNDPHAMEFRRRFLEAIHRRLVQMPPGVPPLAPAYEEFDEDDNADMLQEQDVMNEDDEDSNLTDAATEGTPTRNDATDDGVGDATAREFDVQLPSRHAYLGDGMEAIAGRTILDGGSIVEIPILLMDFHLVPGQTLPLAVSESVRQNALLRCALDDSRHFGVIFSGHNDGLYRAPLPKKALGTTAEIYEYHEEQPPDEIPEPLRFHLPSSIHIKAKGRHRFNVVSTYRQADGHLMAKVKIRPELSLPKLATNWLSANHRYMFRDNDQMSMIPNEIKPLVDDVAVADADADETAVNGGGEVMEQPQNFPSPMDGVEDFTAPLTDVQLRDARAGRVNHLRKVYSHYSAMTPWPRFVYEQYDEEIICHRIKERLLTDLSYLVKEANLPSDPTEFSFWLAQNLTLNNSQRLQLLKMDTPIQRLRFAHRLISNVSRIIECVHCEEVLANHKDIFSMSVEGPQGTYVNPHGFVHELITVTKIHHTVYRGSPSTESSWFPGYSWRIMECRICRGHVGWKFEAVENLVPKKFWGLARRSVNFKYNFSDDESAPEEESQLEELPSI